MKVIQFITLILSFFCSNCFAESFPPPWSRSNQFATSAQWEFNTEEPDLIDLLYSADGNDVPLIIGNGENNGGVPPVPAIYPFNINWQAGTLNYIDNSVLLIFNPLWTNFNYITDVRLQIEYAEQTQPSGHPLIVGDSNNDVSHIPYEMSVLGNNVLYTWRLSYAPVRIRIPFHLPENASIDGIILDTLSGGTFTNIQQGDVNFDGKVDIFDVNIVSLFWDGSGPEGDANKDLYVNIFDVNFISSNWSPSSLIVAEPTSFILLSIGILCLLLLILKQQV